MPRLSTALKPRIDGPFADDWERQRRTAEEILQRLSDQEGVVLADQVGMGKTFVALAVAVSEILAADQMRQVVVFVPARVGQKWILEWNKFKESLLIDDPGIRCVREPIRRGEAFLKAFDDPPDRMDHLVVVTHEALTATLQDGFIQLALIYFALRNKHGAAEIRARVARWSHGKSGLLKDSRFTEDRVAALLDVSPKHWRETWEALTGQPLDDDPIPQQLMEATDGIDLSSLRAVLEALPMRESKGIVARLKSARSALDDATQGVWKSVLVVTKKRLPLIIIDEAHALKNDRTRISRLFTPLPDRTEDGALRGVFDRMLMLTATPFELGHSELISVLSRMDAVHPPSPPPSISLQTRLEALHSALRLAQESALVLDGTWGTVSDHETDAFIAWTPESDPPVGASASVKRAWREAQFAVEARRGLEIRLRPWLIRHTRPNRREYITGAGILPEREATRTGLEIPAASSLPFLLAARAQSLALADSQGGRPLFAYGIASSYEAYLRLEDGDGRDSDDIAEPEPFPEESSSKAEPRSDALGFSWYQQRTKEALDRPGAIHRHPKIEATTQRAEWLWWSGEKTLIFCWYIRTSGALHHALLNRIQDSIKDAARRALSVEKVDVDRELELLADRLFDRDRPAGRHISEFIRKRMLDATSGADTLADALARIAVRNLRSPAFLVRYTSLHPGLSPEEVITGVSGGNPTGIDVMHRWADFAERLSATTRSEQQRVIESLLGDSSGELDPDEGTRGRGASLSPVRRAYGQTRREDRERLITVFNTPFAPDILVASSVMGEGIDLHQECRHVIHHDLDWNPSKLEQRTGRLDRIGALAERQGSKIQVYEPYLAGTHDEKMFRVVKDRAMWFEAVMGRSQSDDEESTDGAEGRVPLHPTIAESLRIDLAVSP